jgi:G:T-mismatch repair DNA endonuclease (very short patch repair protein)
MAVSGMVMIANKGSYLRQINFFGENKIAGNKARDQKNYAGLNTARWDYLVLWGCEIKNMNFLIKKIENFCYKRSFVWKNS